MKRLIAVICFMFAISPLALAQDKAKGGETKGTPPAMKPMAPSADDKKAEAAKAKEEKKAAADAKKAGKKEASEKQKAQQEKMKTCSKDASEKKMKGDERKKFMSTCMKG